MRPENLPELPSSSDELSFHYPSRLRALAGEMRAKIQWLAIAWAPVQFVLWLYGDEIKEWLKGRIASMKLGSFLHSFMYSLVDNLSFVAAGLALIAALAILLRAYKETSPNRRGLAFSEWHGIPVLRLRPGHKIEHEHDVAVEMKEQTRPSGVDEQQAKRYFKNERLLLPAFGPRLEGYTFESCDLYGPAVLAAVGPSAIHNNHLVVPKGQEVDPEAFLWPTPESPRGGVICLSDCRISGCRLFNIAFVGTKKELDGLRKAMHVLRIEPYSPKPPTPDTQDDPNEPEP